MLVLLSTGNSCGPSSVSMGLSRVEIVAVVLSWTLTWLGFVQCQEWTRLTQEEADRIWPRPDLMPAVKPDDNAHEPLIDEPVEQFDLYFFEYDDTDANSTYNKGEARIDTMPSYDKGEARIDSDLTPPFLGPDDAGSDYDPYDDPYEEVDVEDEIDNPTGFNFDCTDNAFKIYLYEKNLDGLKVIHSKRVLTVNESSTSCGYVNKKTGIFLVPFNGCFTIKKTNHYTVQLLAGGTHVLRAACLAPEFAPSKLSPRGGDPPATLSCPFLTSAQPGPPTWTPTGPPSGTPSWTPTGPPSGTPTWPPTIPSSAPTSSPAVTPLTQICSPNIHERLVCSFPGVTKTDCLNDGCCWDPYASPSKRCFYPENECTKDGHFVFTIRHDSAAPYLLNPYSLEIPGTNCGPVLVTSMFALFKFKLDECGTVHYSLGDSSITLAEVQTAVETLTLKYAVISRSIQIRFLIECRHSNGDSSLASAAYMVLASPVPVPSAVFFDGLYGILLSIAKDDTYTDFYETYHPPLRVLLNQRVYLQLRLLSPFPEATIVVNHCIAYPRYYPAVTIFIYEGCPNRNDPGVGIYRTIDFNGERNERRIWVDAFQFREADKYIDEDIYFMCHSYVCLHQLGPCPQHCFDT